MDLFKLIASKIVENKRNQISEGSINPYDILQDRISTLPTKQISDLYRNFFRYSSIIGIHSFRDKNDHEKFRKAEEQLTLSSYDLPEIREDTLLSGEQKEQYASYLVAQFALAYDLFKSQERKNTHSIAEEALENMQIKVIELIAKIGAPY